jgi:hypothetical protein
VLAFGKKETHRENLSRREWGQSPSAYLASSSDSKVKAELKKWEAIPFRQSMTVSCILDLVSVVSIRFLTVVVY